MAETFYFVVADGLNAVDRSRAEYTCQLLRLNECPDLAPAGRDAFNPYRAQFREFVDLRVGQDISDPVLETRRRAIMGKGHPTVWHEMCRQHQRFLRHDEFGHLFIQCPEALSWLSYQTGTE